MNISLYSTSLNEVDASSFAGTIPESEKIAEEIFAASKVLRNLYRCLIPYECVSEEECTWQVS